MANVQVHKSKTDEDRGKKGQTVALLISGEATRCSLGLGCLSLSGRQGSRASEDGKNGARAA